MTFSVYMNISKEIVRIEFKLFLVFEKHEKGRQFRNKNNMNIDMYRIYKSTKYYSNTISNQLYKYNIRQTTATTDIDHSFARFQHGLFSALIRLYSFCTAFALE